MSLFFKNSLNLKNANQLKYLLKFVREGSCIKYFKNPVLVVDTSRRKNETKMSCAVIPHASIVSMPCAVEEFLYLIKKEDADQILVKLETMKKGFVRKIPLSQMTELINILIKKKKVFELSCCVQAMSYIVDNVGEILKPLLEKYSNSGDIDSLNEIPKVIPDFALMKCSFNDHLTKAYISRGRYEDLLLGLEKHWNAKNKLFSTAAFEALLKKPEYEEKVVNLAKKYLECKTDLPLSVVWAYYLTNNKFEKANELSKIRPISADKVDIIVLKAVSQQRNVQMGELYISALNYQNAKSRCKERAYGTLLDVLVSKERYNDATALLAEAKENKVCLDKHYRSTLIKLKNALETESKIPLKAS